MDVRFGNERNHYTESHRGKIVFSTEKEMWSCGLKIAGRVFKNAVYKIGDFKYRPDDFNYGLYLFFFFYKNFTYPTSHHYPFSSTCRVSRTAATLSLACPQRTSSAITFRTAVIREQLNVHGNSTQGSVRKRWPVTPRISPDSVAVLHTNFLSRRHTLCTWNEPCFQLFQFLIQDE